MDHPHCFNTNQNVDYRQRSQTLQPIRGRDRFDMKDQRNFHINKCFLSLHEADRAKQYANVPMNHDESHILHPPMVDSIGGYKQHQHLHLLSNPSALHSRSQSQHHYHTMCQDLNNYYNLTNIRPVVPNSRGQSPIHEPPPQAHNYAQLDSITIMQVCNEFGNLDSPPPTPAPRNYTISRNQDGSLAKVMLPHKRWTKFTYTDHIAGASLPPGSPISILAASKEDRSKFSSCICLDGVYKYIDIPHHLTQPPTTMSTWLTFTH